MSTDKNTGPDQSDSSVTARENLSLVSIDEQGDRLAIWDAVCAISFAARAGHKVHTTHRFISALTLTHNLTSPGMWGHVLKTVTDLEAQATDKKAPS